MIPLLARAIDALVSAAGLDIPAPPDMGSVIQQFAQQFTSMATLALTTVDSAVIVVARLAYASILMIGLVLYYTHVERRLGKDLIKGGILLAVLSEFVFPLISKL
jgi:hypothetical protein